MTADLFYFTIIYRRKMFFCINLYAGILLLFLYIANHNYNNGGLSFAIIVMIVLPLIFLKYTRRLFISRGTLEINSEGFKMNFFKKRAIKQKNLLFKDIEFYTISFPTSEFNVINFILYNNSKIELSFGDFEKDNTIASSKIISLLNKSIKDYNNNSNIKRIKYKSTFVASKNGLVALIAIRVLIIVAIILHIITGQYKTIPVSLICGLLLLMQVSNQRKIDLNYYKENIENG
jgi:hypothetical protein